MSIVTKPSRLQTKDLHEQEASQQSSAVGGRGKVLLPDIISLLKSKDAATAMTAAPDGVDLPKVDRNDDGLLHVVGERTPPTTIKESGDVVEFESPKSRTASESAAEEIAEELAVVFGTGAARAAEKAALPAVVSMSTMGASNSSFATGNTINGVSTARTPSGYSSSVETTSELEAVPGKQKKKSNSKEKKMMVDHTYHEHMNDLPPMNLNKSSGSRRKSRGRGVASRSGSGDRLHSSLQQQYVRGPTRGGVQHPFPATLHKVLEEMEKNGHENIMSWMPHGRCFMVKEPKEFVKDYMPTYFNQHKFASFQRQLNLYGFKRLTSQGPDKGAYYHELFLRGKPYLGYQIMRVRIKGTGVRAASNPDGEPNFYQMPYCYGDSRAPRTDIRQQAVAEPALIDPQEALPKTRGSDKDPPAEAKLETSSCRSESEPPVWGGSSPLLSPEISPPPSPTTMSENPLSKPQDKLLPIKKRKPVTSAMRSGTKKKKRTTSRKKNVCINPMTMELINSTPYSSRSPNNSNDSSSSLADFESIIRPLEGDKITDDQPNDYIDEVSFCGCHYHYMGHLNRDALNEIEAFHPPDSIAIPSSLASDAADMNFPYLIPNMMSSLTVPETDVSNQITPSSSTEQVHLCRQCGGTRSLVAPSNNMTEQNWPTLEAPVLSRHVSFEDHEHDGDYDTTEGQMKGVEKSEGKKTVSAYSEPHRSAKEEMDHFFESLELPYDYLSDVDIEEHEMMNLDSDEKLAAALENVVN